MRLVAWNANHNNRRRALEENIELLSPFRADILVISETAPPADGNSTRAQWIGRDGYPGLAVVAHDDLTLEPHLANRLSPPLMMGFGISGRVALNLLAIWPVKYENGPSYAKILDSALEQYADLLGAGNAIMAGDLNSSVGVSGQESSHRRFVATADALGLASAYHHLADEDHGSESFATYRHSKTRSFHIDYCFVSTPLLPSTNFGIAQNEEWKALSDHNPLVLDIPDSVLLPL